jgi:hypothetical protein
MHIAAAYVVALAVPLILWWLAAGVLRRGDQRPFFAVISGADARLSLSRLQAFLWTFVIVGTYVSAMMLHPPIEITTPAEAEVRGAASKKADEALAAAQATREAKAAELAAKEIDVKAQKVLEDRAVYIAKRPELAADANAKKIADDQVAKKVIDHHNADWAREDAKAALDEADTAVLTLKKNAEEKKAAWRRTKWVAIPAELLALAGISLASGVFASVISVTAKSELPPPDVTGVTFANNIWTIIGSGFGKDGEVRLGGRAARPVAWTETQLTVTSPVQGPKFVVVDVAGGKVAYNIAWTNKTPTLDGRIKKYEWGDLFRDDDKPTQFSLMKLQMFAWTLVALAIYICIFASGVWRSDQQMIDSLPIVDTALVLLTGLSQAGYLGGKAASSQAAK